MHQQTSRINRKTKYSIRFNVFLFKNCPEFFKQNRTKVYYEYKSTFLFFCLKIKRQ